MIGCGGFWWFVFVGELKCSLSIEILCILDIVMLLLFCFCSLYNEEYIFCLIWWISDLECLLGGSCLGEWGFFLMELELVFDRGDKWWSWFLCWLYCNFWGICGKMNEDILRFLGCWRCFCRLGILMIEVNIFYFLLLLLFVRMSRRM